MPRQRVLLGRQVPGLSELGHPSRSSRVRPEPLKYPTSSGETWPAVLDPEEEWDCGPHFITIPVFGLVPLFFVYFSVFKGGLREDGVLLEWVLSS